nr:MAK10-like protein [Tanacetum cinerariifolium]
MQPTQVNKITSSCEICSGPHDTHYCMENLEQAFVEYAHPRVPTKREVSGSLSNPSETTLVTLIIGHGKVTQTLVLSARSYLTEDPQCSTRIHGSINTIPLHQSNPHNDKPEEDKRKGESNPENTNTDERKEEQRDALQPELEEPTDIKNLGPSRHDEEREIEWLDVQEPLDLVDKVKKQFMNH